MAEYKGNSFKIKENKDPVKKFSSVVSGTTTVKPKSETKKFLSSILPGSGDISDLKKHIIQDNVIPTLKDLVVDGIDMVIDAIFYPDAPRRGHSRRVSGSYTSYGNYYRSSDRRDRDRPAIRTSMFDIEEVSFTKRGDAETVLYTLEEAISQYGSVTVGDFYDLAGRSTTNLPHTINKYGWTDLVSAKVCQTRGGFYIRFPKPLPID